MEAEAEVVADAVAAKARVAVVVVITADVEIGVVLAVVVLAVDAVEQAVLPLRPRKIISSGYGVLLRLSLRTYAIASD